MAESVRHRDVTPEEVADARAELAKAKKKGDYEAQTHAMEVLAILRAAEREQYAELGLRNDRNGVRTEDATSLTYTVATDRDDLDGPAQRVVLLKES